MRLVNTSYVGGREALVARANHFDFRKQKYEVLRFLTTLFYRRRELPRYRARRFYGVDVHLRRMSKFDAEFRFLRRVVYGLGTAIIGGLITIIFQLWRG